MGRAPFYLRIFVVSIADKGYVIQDSEATTVESASKFKFRIALWLRANIFLFVSLVFI